MTSVERLNYHCKFKKDCICMICLAYNEGQKDLWESILDQNINMQNTERIEILEEDVKYIKEEYNLK